MTRHPEQHKVVLSHWRDQVCVASTPVEISEISALIGVLADALGDAVQSLERPFAAPSADTRLLARVKAWLKPRMAQIVELTALVKDKPYEQTG